MNNLMKVIMVLVLVAAIGVVIAMKNRHSGPEQTAQPQASPPNASSEAAPLPGPPAAATGVPKLVDLGAGTCIPCKMMAPILDELKDEFEGRLEVVFIDVRENPNEGRKYGISLIPTQIFFDGEGKELFRHQGFFSREDILGTWKRFGYDLAAATPEEPDPSNPAAAGYESGLK